MRSIAFSPCRDRPKASEWRWMEYSEPIPVIGKNASRHAISVVVEESSAATEEMAAQASAVTGSIQYQTIGIGAEKVVVRLHADKRQRWAEVHKESGLLTEQVWVQDVSVDTVLVDAAQPIGGLPGARVRSGRNPWVAQVETASNQHGHMRRRRSATGHRKRERLLQRFKSAEHAQHFLGPFSAVCNHFRAAATSHRLHLAKLRLKPTRKTRDLQSLGRQAR